MVIDDDLSVRKALVNLFESVGLAVHAFASVDGFRTWPMPDSDICMVLDVRMPGTSGLDFQTELAAMHGEIPIVFITAHGDVPMSVRAMKAGAVEFLTKPFRDQDLIDATYAGLAKSRARRNELEQIAELRAKYESLSRREREIMDLVVQGQLSKQIAAKLHLSEITVKVCRSQIMRKLSAGSLVELGRMSEKLSRANRREA